MGKGGLGEDTRLRDRPERCTAPPLVNRGDAGRRAGTLVAARLLPPAQGKLTVVLDMDGTLISSFTPARAPRLPGGMITYVVGRGARINPKGVFVVERPGLKEFFAQLCEFAGAPQPVLP